jgi:hypothetical protein
MAILPAMILSLLLHGCGTLMGLKKPNPQPEEAIADLADTYRIPAADCYVMDSSYIRQLKEMYTGRPIALKDHLQPLQAIYFSKENSFQYPVSLQVNCYTGGFPNLKWNREGRMDQFPPAQQAPLDSILSLKKTMEFLRPVTGVIPFNSINYDYIVVVYWNRFMGRQSKNLLHTVRKNATLAGNKRIKILYVNNDNLFSLLK